MYFFNLIIVLKSNFLKKVFFDYIEICIMIILLFFSNKNIINEKWS